MLTESPVDNCPLGCRNKLWSTSSRRDSDEISERIGRKINLATQKPYTGTHNFGHTECHEFFGAITLDSYDPLGNRVTMLDVALRGIGDRWNDVMISGFDFCAVENN
jgi:hypothetical protein